MKTGIELIAIERKEQIEKHGRTVECDVKENSQGELAYMAGLLSQDHAEAAGMLDYLPPTWDKNICAKMMRKPYKERLIIAGAMIAAEIDRLNNSKTK